MSLEVLIMASLSCNQNLEKKGVYCPLAFRCHRSEERRVGKECA